MASKSKRRRRVLGASCILAALIVASSSFAWFTSKDEVTNRLSAQADYGVSIVESFAPPENWLPGQQINKDVYAVNTGNVEAFVEETVSGVLTITTEKATDTLTANSIKLNAAERYVVEAGAYLAWAPTTSNHKQGEKVVAMVPNSTDLDGYTTADALTDFTPDAAGLYVFRRSIGVNADKTETFKYDGYYYDGHDYYKISNLKVTPDGLAYAGDNDTSDGNLTNATAGFYEEETVTAKPTLTYDGANNRLVATYDTGASIDMTDLADLAKAYDDALIAYEDAIEEYKAALRDDNSTDADVVAANTTLQQKLDALREAQNGLADAQAEKAATAQALLDAQAAKAATAQALLDAQDADDDAQDAVDAAQDADDDAQDAVDAAQDAVDAAQDAVDAAQDAVDAATSSERTAYLNYIVQNVAAVGTTEQAETYLENVSYDDLNTLAIDNTSNAYNYHQLLVAKKKAEKDLATAQATLAQKEAAKAATAQALLDAQAAKAATAQALLDAQAADDDAQDAVDAAQAADDDAQDAVDAAQAAVDAAQDAVNDAQNAYGDATTAAGGASDDVTTAANALAVARQAMTEAQNAYENAVDARDGVLKININLADAVTTVGGVADKWQLLPDPVNGGIAYFYYTGILGAGETSAQLIDSVELDSSVTDDMFKRFDFDLNVALKSAQIAYDADGNITTDAADTLFDANATLETPTSVDSVVNWTLK